MVAFLFGGRRCNDRPTARVLKIMLPKSLDCDSAKQSLVPEMVKALLSTARTSCVFIVLYKIYDCGFVFY